MLAFKDKHSSIYLYVKKHTVFSAQVGGMKSVRPPSMQIRFLKIVTGIGARYLWENIILPLCQSPLPSLYSKNISVVEKAEILVLEEKDRNNKTNLESTKVKNIPWYKRRSENCINQILLRVKLIYKQGPQWSEHLCYSNCITIVIVDQVSSRLMSNVKNKKLPKIIGIWCLLTKSNILNTIQKRTL